MEAMFLNAMSFNQCLQNWDVSSVENMKLMFWKVKNLCHSFSNWKVDNLEMCENMFEECDEMMKIFPKLEARPSMMFWEENFNRAKPTKGARH